MTAPLPRVVATRFAAVRKGSVEYGQRVTLEVVYLSGANKNFKIDLDVVGARNESVARDDLKDKLAAELQAMNPTDTWRARDILLYGF